jgi:hypothetical protein
MLKTTATPMAMMMLNFKGKWYAAMAVTAATLAAKIRIRVLANEHKMPTKHKVPAKPKPQEVGMSLAKKIPAKLAAIQLTHIMQVLPARDAACAN